MAAIVNKDNNNENANKKTILTQYAFISSSKIPHDG